MWQVPSVDPNGTRDVFYYHKNYYVRPAGDLGSHSFWSSSLASLREERCSIIFSGFYGEVREAYHEWWINPGDSYAVRCVAGK